MATRNVPDAVPKNKQQGFIEKCKNYELFEERLWFNKKDKEGSDIIAKILVEEIICRYGTPTVLLSDCGKEFLNKLVTSITNLFNIKKKNTTAYHPQTNGLMERFNHTLCLFLMFYLHIGL